VGCLELRVICSYSCRLNEYFTYKVDLEPCFKVDLEPCLLACRREALRDVAFIPLIQPPPGLCVSSAAWREVTLLFMRECLDTILHTTKQASHYGVFMKASRPTILFRTAPPPPSPAG
jgi:hypothetical protein